MHAYLRSTWQRICGNPAANEDFLAGADGIAATTRLVVELRRSGFAVSARDVLKHHTVSALAAILPERNGTDLGDYPAFGDVWATSCSPWTASSRCVIPLAQGRGTPLFFVHNGLGYIRFIEPVIDGFRRGRPVYGFESAGIRDRRRPAVSIPEIAARYVNELRDIQGHGPYRLAGICTGSHIAFEMAHQLVDAGQEVAALALINASRPGVRQVPAGWGLEDLYHERLADVQLMFGDNDIANDLPGVIATLRALDWIDDIRLEDFYWHAAVAAANTFAQEHYDPRKFAGAAGIFQPTRSRRGDSADWTPVAPGATYFPFDEDNSLPVLTSPLFADFMARQPPTRPST